MTDVAIGTFWRFSARFCAVTIITPKVVASDDGELDGAGASAAVASGRSAFGRGGQTR